ncbi:MULTISPECIES: P1 family peptidase [unclassified Microbacterium]|uniref:P1 family peptidase n=1 Tax=Microbacterium sp. Se63.02b TaxID=2709304 RepID=UPI001FCEFA4E|nr:MULTISPECIES: P1 family peptidase [unclassified Microbacterium]
MTSSSPSSRARLADLGVPSGAFARGAANAITDVVGVRVGHATVHGDGLHTGVTAIVPDALSAERRSLPANLAVGNGYGKLVGATQLQELGAIETPILLTSTLSVFRVADAFLGHLLATPAHGATTTLNPIVGETNDGFLSDIRRRAVGRSRSNRRWPRPRPAPSRREASARVPARSRWGTRAASARRHEC